MPIESTTARALQRAGKKLEAATQERNELIIKAEEEGASLREIASILGMNHVTVSNLIKKIREGNATDAHFKRTGIGPDETRF